MATLQANHHHQELHSSKLPSQPSKPLQPVVNQTELRMNQELRMLQVSKYITFGTITVILAILLALIGLWVYSEWLIYRSKKDKDLDKVRDKMDGIEMKRLLKQQEEAEKAAKAKEPKVMKGPINLRSLDDAV